MTFGSGDYIYDFQENWWTLPDGWTFGWIPAVACDSQDRVYDLFRVLGIQTHRPGIDISVMFEQERFAFHHWL